MPISRFNLWNKIYRHIDKLINKATKKTNEDLLLVPHCENVLDWGKKILKGNIDTPLKIALFGHDIERAYPDKVRKGNKSYDLYKAEHSLQSAEKLKSVLINFNADEMLVNEVYILVKYHDVFNATPKRQQSLLDKLGILRDADALSYFDVQFDKYLKKYDVVRTAEKLKWTYDRLTSIAKERKRADGLYEDCKIRLLHLFEKEVIKYLKIERLDFTEKYLNETYEKLQIIFTLGDLDMPYTRCLDMIEVERKKIRDLL